MAAAITFGEISCPRAAEEEEGEANPTGDPLSPYEEQGNRLHGMRIGEPA